MVDDTSSSTTTTAEKSSAGERGQLLRNWVSTRVADAESYWLLRRTLAQHLGLMGLVEQLLQLTPLTPDCLIVDCRTGRAEARHALFDLSSANAAAGSKAAAATTQQLLPAFMQCMGFQSASSTTGG